jgi:hypothetical protein
MMLKPMNSKYGYARDTANAIDGGVCRRGLDNQSLDADQNSEHKRDPMTSSPEEATQYPLLEPLLRQKGLSPNGIYKVRDAATIFDVSTRTIQEWVRNGRLLARELPGRGKFLCGDLELFLRNSLKRAQEPEDGANSNPEIGSVPMGRLRGKHMKRLGQAR